MEGRTPYDMVVQAHEQIPDAPVPMHDHEGGIVVDADGRKRKAPAARKLSEYMERADRQVEQAAKDRPEFTYCRRLAKTPASEIGPDDRVDRCYVCKCRVLYNVRHSQGLPHLCTPCFAYNAERGLTATLMPAPPEYSRENDEKLAQWMVSRCGCAPEKVDPERFNKGSQGGAGV